MPNHRRRRGFTIIELLVVVSIIALLIGILLPAIGKAREQAQVTVSNANLRNLGTAHAAYSAEWGDRHFTLVADNLTYYGANAQAAMSGYSDSNGGEWHPPVYLGWGYSDAGFYAMWKYTMDWGPHMTFVQPIVFESANGYPYLGSFRLAQCRQFNGYMSGRFYDKAYYAPKDLAVVDTAAPCFDSPAEFCQLNTTSLHETPIPAWSSYVFSPAAMYNPAVFRHLDPADGENSGWRSPYSIKAGFKSPSFSQALYPNLKSQMIEHHWLQNRQAECNPAFSPGTYDGCEPYYFNHAFESAPVTLFFDGHIELLGVRETMRADGRMRTQSGSDMWGLWSKDTPWGSDGYMSDLGYDQATTSFHILTTDGIRGRDVMDG